MVSGILLSAFQSDHSGLRTFHSESKEIPSFLHVKWEKKGVAQALNKSALGLSRSKGKHLDKVGEASEVLICAEPLHLIIY